MTYEQKRRLDHYTTCLTLFALAVVLVIAVACLVVCLYDPTMGRFCFDLIVASVVISFTVWFLCLAFCEIISWCLFNGFHNQGGIICRFFIPFDSRSILLLNFRFYQKHKKLFSVFLSPSFLIIPFSVLPRFPLVSIRRF